MKRVVSSSIISVIILLLIAVAFFYFQIKRNSSTTAYKLIPADVAWIVSVDPRSGDLQRVVRSAFLNGGDSIGIFKKWTSELLFFDSLCVNDAAVKNALGNSPLLISGHVAGTDGFELLFVAELQSGAAAEMDQLVAKITGVNNEGIQHTYNGVEIKEMKMASGLSFSWAIVGGVFVGSKASFLVEDAIRQEKGSMTNAPALEVEKIPKKDPSGFFIAFRYSGLAMWLKSQMNPSSQLDFSILEHFGEWTFLHLDVHSGMISFNGTSMSTDTSAFISYFDHQKPVERKLNDWLPSKTAAAIIWGLSDPYDFLKTKYQMDKSAKSRSEASGSFKYFSAWMGNEIALVVTQPTLNLSDNNFLALISVKDSLKCQQSLQKMAGASTEAVEYYNGYTIRYIPQRAVLEDEFGKLFKRVNKFYYTAINHHIVIGNQASVIRAYINDVKTGNMLKNEERFRSLTTHIPSKGNILFYAGIPQGMNIFNGVANAAWTKWIAAEGSNLKNWNALVFSVSNAGDGFQTSGCLGHFNKSATVPQLQWNSKLEAKMAAGPFCPMGIHGLILAEDINQQLYAFDAAGDLKWKKKLETPLLSEVFTVDFYNNGGHQYLFNTHSFIYLLDSAGNFIANYPIRLPAEASSGLSLIQHKEPGADHFYIPCKNLRLYAYLLSGKPVPGYSTLKLPGVIIRPVYYNKEQDKLILLEENGVCFVAGTNGQRLFTVRGTIVLKENDTFFSIPSKSSLFSFISSEGKLFEVDSLGEILRSAISVEDSICSIAGADLNGDNEIDWIAAGAEGLSSKTADGLILFRFKGPEAIEKVMVHAIGEKVIIMALSADKIYLFNRDGTLAEGFPLSGTELPKVVSGKNDENYLLFKSGEDNFNLFQIQGR